MRSAIDNAIVYLCVGKAKAGEWSPALFNGRYLQVKMIRTVISILSIWLLVSVDAYACSCIKFSNIDTAYYRASVVFLGKVDRIIKEDLYQSQQDRLGTNFINFKVIQGYKRVEESELPLTFIDDGTNCGYDFKEGEEYVVFGYHYGCGFAVTDICTRTSLAKDFDKEDLRRIEFLAANPHDDHFAKEYFIDITNSSLINQLEHSVHLLKAENLNLQKNGKNLWYMIYGLGLVIAGLVLTIIKIKKTSR